MKNDKKLRKKSLVVLDIGTNTIKIALGRYNNKKVAFKKIIKITTPPHCISNGRIKDYIKLTEVIKEGLKENKINGHYSVVNVKSSSFINREITLPFNDDKKTLDNIIYYEMKQYFAIKLDLYVIQYQIIEEFFENKAKMMRVIVTAIEKSIVNDYFKLVKDVGLKPYVFDVHFNTISKFFWLYSESVKILDKSIMVVDVGYTTTDVTIMVNGQYKMSRTIDLGSNVLNHMLLHEFQVDIQDKALSEVLNNYSEEMKIRIRESLLPLVDEINNIVRYHITRDSKNAIDGMCVTGGLSNLSEMTEFLNESLKIKKQVCADLSQIVTGLPDDDVSNYFTLIGAMIRR